MNRMAIMAAAGLSIGVLGGTGAAWMKRPAAAADVAVAADSAQHADAVLHADSVHSTAHDTSAVDSVADADEQHTATPLPDAPAVAAAQPGATHANSSAEQDVERLAQIIGVMKPQEAARVLERLEDAQIRRLLLSVSDRKAAAILAQIPPDRAAALAARILERKEP